MNALIHSHSGFRWIVLGLLIYSIFHAFKSWKADKAKGKDKILTFTMIACHIQMAIGFALYFMSAKVQFNETTMVNAITRFFTVEHVFGMLVAIVLVSISKRKVQNATTSAGYKSAFIMNLIALVIILATIPWPFRNMGSGWF